jgi:penicillin-binding protein 1A
MERNGFITASERAEAQAQTLGTVRGPRNSVKNVGGYFMEEVRRQLVQRYGEDDKTGSEGAEQRLCRRPVGPHLL